MQSLLSDPRGSMTEDQVIHLIRDCPGIIIGSGCELLNMSLEVMEDITPYLYGGSVSRNSYATMHAKSTLHISTLLDWGQAIVRPYMTISDGGLNTAQFYLGAYYTSVPRHTLGETPITYEVQGYDILHGLADTVGEVYALAAGQSYLAAIQQILIERNYTQYIIDQTAAAKVLPVPKIWAMDERTTWLSIINDLLTPIGYQGIWSDWLGVLHCQPYINPNERAHEWLYDTSDQTSMLALEKEVELDFYDSPNRWVAVKSNAVDGDPPVEGNGIFIYINEYHGETSVEARGGRVITRYLSIEASDHDSLVSQAFISIYADMHRQGKIKVSSSPNPLHWHFDRVRVQDPGLGTKEVLVTDWTLSLIGDNMAQEWSVI